MSRRQRAIRETPLAYRALIDALCVTPPMTTPQATALRGVLIDKFGVERLSELPKRDDQACAIAIRAWTFEQQRRPPHCVCPTRAQQDRCQDACLYPEPED